MTLQEIVDFTRYRLGNYEQPYYWIDAELVLYCNEVIDKLCFEAKILEDSTNAATCDIYLTEGTASYSLHNSVFYIRSVKLIEEHVLTLGVPPVTAWSVGDTITGVSSGSTSIVKTVVSIGKYVVTNLSGAYTSGEVLTNGSVQADQGTPYPLVTIYKSIDLDKSTTLQMDERSSSWVGEDNDEPRKYIIDYNARLITFYPPPDSSYQVKLSVYRYPITAMTTTNLAGQTPEIDARYHDMIINGICALAYMKRGENTFDLQKSVAFSTIFKADLARLKVRNTLYRGNNEIAAPHRGFM